VWVRPVDGARARTLAKLDIVPAQFFDASRHIRGKWACKVLPVAGAEEPVRPHIIDRGMPAEGLLAHTLVGRFVDHAFSYYRQSKINTLRCARRARHGEHEVEPD
jgi:transposase